MFEIFINKKAKIFLKNGFVYAGLITEATDNFLSIKDDKKQLDVIINCMMIDKIIEEKNDN